MFPLWVVGFREQVMFPLQFADLLGAVDLRATVGAAGGPSGQAGAIRHATAAALQSFVDRDMAEKMRLGTAAAPRPPADPPLGGDVVLIRPGRIENQE